GAAGLGRSTAATLAPHSFPCSVRAELVEAPLFSLSAPREEKDGPSTSWGRTDREGWTEVAKARGGLDNAHVPALGRDADLQAIQLLSQHDLARQPARALNAHCQVEHVLLLLARLGQAREPFRGDDDVAGRA